MDRRRRGLCALGLAVAFMAGGLWLAGSRESEPTAPPAGLPEAQRVSHEDPVPDTPTPEPTEPIVELTGSEIDDRDPAPAVEAERVFDHLPTDPIETGDCELALRLFDSETRDPVESDVFLWRLDAPGNENWTDGDQLQARESIPKDGFTFGSLPAGDYRVVCVEERFDAVDHKMFRVEGPETRVDLNLLMPRARKAHVQIYSVDGNVVKRATIASRGHTPGTRPVDRPEWLRERELRGRLDKPGAFGLGGGGAGLVKRRSLSTAEEEGFLLGRIKEDRRSTRARYFFDVTPPALSTTHVQIDASHEQLQYVGVAIDPQYIVSRLRQPNGAPVDDAVKAHIDIVATAVHCSGRDPAEMWSRVEINVKVADRRFETLRFSFRWEDGDLPDQYLRLR